MSCQRMRCGWGLAIGFLAICFFAMALPAGCTKEPAKSSTGGSSAGATDPIKIGHYASISGSEATFGISTDNGIKLAIEEKNAAGGIKGRKVELLTLDDQGKDQEVTTAVTRLITNDKVVALLGEVASGRSIIGGQVAQRYGVPMITPSSTKPSVTEIGEMIFRVCFIDPFQGDVCAQFALTKGWKKAAVLTDRTAPYATGLRDNFKESFKRLGGAIVADEQYSSGDSDFGAQATNIRGAQPDVIFIPGYYTDVGNIALQLRKMGLTQPLLGGDGWDSPELVKTAGEALDGCFYSNHYSYEENRPAVKEFVDKFKKRFNGQVPDGMAALGYDAANVLFAAMEKAPSLDGKDLAKAIAATRDFPAVTGTISIDAKRNAKKSAVMLGLKNKEWRYISSIAPPAE